MRLSQDVIYSIDLAIMTLLRARKLVAPTWGDIAFKLALPRDQQKAVPRRLQELRAQGLVRFAGKGAYGCWRACSLSEPHDAP